jgi:hypothetical protein
MSGPASAERSADAVAVSAPGLSIDGTIPKMYTGTSIRLATADTCGGFSRLRVSEPSVKTMTARRRPSRAPTRCAVSAIASWSDVAPNGTTEVMASGSVLRPRVNALTSSSRVSNVKTAASSRPSSQLRTWAAASRALARRPSMLPLTSKSKATLTPEVSGRKSVMVRGHPPSSTSKSRADRSRTNRPLWSRTTAAMRTTSIPDLNVATGGC